MRRFAISLFVSLLTLPLMAQNPSFCNPLNLNYRFMPDVAVAGQKAGLPNPSRREAADPVILMFNDKYYLFASKSGGYWMSDDMVDWRFITNDLLPWEDYAPTAVVMDDAVYFMAMDKRIYKSTDPASGKWTVVKEDMPISNPGDPCLFLDDDGRMYLYSGLSNLLPTYGVEVDPKTWDLIGEQVECVLQHKDDYGWERIGDYNTLNKKRRPYIEGSWMNKFGNKYYLQYSAPGTQYKSYCDGVYVADSPLGPFTLQAHNPFAYKPEGFICGAGHGCTFYDRYGQLWHIGSMTISIKEKFERRLGLWPAFVDKDGVLFCYTAFGDYPHDIPNKKLNSYEDYQPKWMLLSYGKPVTVSSTLEGHPAQNATDEDVRTWWSAATGNKGEWLCVDLQEQKTIGAIQVNYAEEGSTLYLRTPEDYHQYLVEVSIDGKKWKTYADKRQAKANTHEYLGTNKPVKARYVRVTNHHVPSGQFSVSGLRVFGKGNGKAPVQVTGLTAQRNIADSTQVLVKWNPSDGAQGYNVRFGIAPDKLYHTYQVMDKNELQINSLNRLQEKYYFTIDAFNENGVTKGQEIVNN